jgi:hypothetical protein
VTAQPQISPTLGCSISPFHGGSLCSSNGATCCRHKKAHIITYMGFFHVNASSSILSIFLLTFSRLSSNSTSFPKSFAIRSTYSSFFTGFSPCLLTYSLRLYSPRDANLAMTERSGRSNSCEICAIGHPNFLQR